MTLEYLLTIRSSVEGVLESFHFGLFQKNASVNICGQVFHGHIVSFLLVVKLRVEMSGETF